MFLESCAQLRIQFIPYMVLKLKPYDKEYLALLNNFEATQKSSLTPKCLFAKYVSYFLGIKGVDEPPGITHSKLSHPPMTSPQCLWMRSLSGTDISSSTC